MHALDERSTLVYLYHASVAGWDDFDVRGCCHILMFTRLSLSMNMLRWHLLPLHDPSHRPPHFSLCACVCLHNPKMPLRSISSNTRKGQFGVLRCHTSPSLPVLSSRVHRVPKLCPRTSCPPSHTHSLLSSLPLTLSPSALCVSPVSSFLKNGVSSGFTLAASRGIHGNKPVHGER